jgi:hypothetical protein
MRLAAGKEYESVHLLRWKLTSNKFNYFFFLVVLFSIYSTKNHCLHCNTFFSLKFAFLLSLTLLLKLPSERLINKSYYYIFPEIYHFSHIFCGFRYMKTSVMNNRSKNKDYLIYTTVTDDRINLEITLKVVFLPFRFRKSLLNLVIVEAAQVSVKLRTKHVYSRTNSRLTV